jgi:hypothetical protein
MGKIRGGYIKGVLYSLYAVSRDSPIDRNPGKYGVVLPAQDPELDLRPGYAVFEHSGMSHEKAVELQLEFSGKIAEAATTIDFVEKAASALSGKGKMPDSKEKAPESLLWKRDSLLPRADAEEISQKAYDVGSLAKYRVRKG